MNSLKMRGWDVFELVQLIGGKILKRNKEALVQWDAIIVAEKNVDKRIYFVEVKESCHENDINGISGDIKSEKSSLYSRGMRTVDHLKQLNDNDYMAANIRTEFRAQCNLLRTFASHNIFLCYGSRYIREEIKHEILSMKCEFETNCSSTVNICTLEYDTRLRIEMMH